MNIASCVLCLSGESWFVVWVGAELSTLFFTSTLSIAHSEGYPTWVSSWNYLLFQTLGSLFLVLPLLVGGSPLFDSQTLVTIGLTLNLGLFPFQGWVFYVMENASVEVITILSSVQNIPPLVFLSAFWGEHTVVLALLTLTSIGGGLYSVQANSVKHLLSCSSVVISSWLCAACLLGSSEVFWFFITYFVHLCILLKLISKEILFGEESLQTYLPNPPVEGVANISALFLGVLAGVPPFGVFLMNIEVVSEFLLQGSVILPLSLSLGSIIMLVGYLKLAVPFILSGEKNIFLNSVGTSYLVPTTLFLLSILLFV